MDELLEILMRDKGWNEARRARPMSPSST